MTSTEARSATGQSEKDTSLKVAYTPRYGQWLATIVVIGVAVLIAGSLLTNPRYQWDVVFSYFRDVHVVGGLVTTIVLTVVAMVVGIIIGVVVAVCRGSRNRFVVAAAAAYAGFFRGTPLLVQLIFWFNLAALYPVLSIGIPFGPTLVSVDANTLITPYVAAILGLGLNEGAYMSEIVRAGLGSVDPGQTQAAQALGMRRRQIFRRITVPQAMRMIIPPTGNQTISMLKTTSLVSVIAIPEILFRVQEIYSRTYEVIPLLITVSLWYLVVTAVLSTGQYYLERHFTRGDARTGDRSLLAALRAGVIPRRAKVPASTEGGGR
jgi:polar amino acid transport system permease protein